jgi:outer membrane protein OmpA-like peptidoglycan-associated protein
MRTYRYSNRGLARALRLLGVLLLALSCVSVAQAQERRYLFEVGLAGAYQTYGDSTELKGSIAEMGRFGVWLPLNFGLEAEGLIAKPKIKAGDTKVSVKSGAISLLYNVPVGTRSSVYGKLGVGGTKYGSGGSCSSSGATICGTTSNFPVVGLGVRVGMTPTWMLRAETVVSPNKGSSTTGILPVKRTIKFTNFGVNVGVSLMLGSKPLPDNDHDGIPNNRDRCDDTPSGAQVNEFGCPTDNDGDGVANGLDRCPNTAVGATVDSNGCPRDSDGDNIADGVDRCPDTPAGVLVDSTGCPKDSDGDSIADGLDRCSDTPKGATVDALGCPGDEDSDGVLDGLDRCPRTSIGAAVNASGCSSSQAPTRSPSSAPTQPSPAPPPRQAPSVSPQPPAGSARVLEGVTFEPGSARLQAGSYVELDSIAKFLLANPTTRIEIGGHTDDSGVPADNMRISSLRAEAVRNYLVAKGVPFQQLVARGYGASAPLTPDTTPRGRAANRRVEIRQLPPGT